MKQFIWTLILPLMGLSLLTGTGYTQEASLELDGLIKPSAVVDIGAAAKGIVDTIRAERTHRVEAGQVLLSLDSTVEKLVLKKAMAMAAFDGDILLNQAQLSFAQRAEERIRNIEAVPSHDKDQAKTEIEINRYQLKKVQENRQLATLEMEQAEAALARRSVVSPISGVVVERYVSEGEYVNGQPVMKVARIDPLSVEVIVPAATFGKIRPGMTAQVQPELDIYPSKLAVVTLVDRVIDAASNTYGIRLELPNPDLTLPGGLKCRVVFKPLTKAQGPIPPARPEPPAKHRPQQMASGKEVR